MQAPIIFCHYGNSDYLSYVCKAAHTSNPEKTIVLLGDESNQWLGELDGVEHHFFTDFADSPELRTFEQVYQLIQGAEHNYPKGGQDWVNFVFKRWFFVYNYCRQQQIQQFWHFDSDNMILDALAPLEARFAGYDCTEQCNGSCLNGYVSGPEVVLGYLNKINELFQRESYLEAQRQEFANVNPGFAFTEMRAYEVYKKEAGVNSTRLNQIIDASSFDDCICQEHGMEMETLPKSQTIKKVYCSNAGQFYCQELSSQRYIRMHSLNLSWVPTALFNTLLTQLSATECKQTADSPLTDNQIAQLPTLAKLYAEQNAALLRKAKIREFVRHPLRALRSK